MKIITKSHEVEVTEAIRNYLQDKFDSIARHVGNKENIEADVEFGKTSEHHKNGDIFRIKSNLKIGSRKIHVDCVGADVYAVIDETKEKLLDEIAHKKDKEISLLRRSARRFKDFFKKTK
jgi:putative sigma-54 modulation protein